MGPQLSGVLLKDFWLGSLFLVTVPVAVAAKTTFLHGDYWAYAAGITATLTGAVIVFFDFPKKAREGELPAGYHGQDAPTSLARATGESASASMPVPRPLKGAQKMTVFDELVSQDGVLMAGQFGPDGRLAEQEVKGLFIEYPPAQEMAEWVCAAVAAMFNTMAYAMNSQSPGAESGAGWLPVKNWTLTAGDYFVEVHGDRVLLAETGKVKSFDELRRLMREGGP